MNVEGKRLEAVGGLLGRTKEVLVKEVVTLGPDSRGSSNCNSMESYPQTKSKGIEGDVIAAE